jgi:hypothetical protein
VYTATDSNNNKASVTQSVIVTDNLKPVIGLNMGGTWFHKGKATDTAKHMGGVVTNPAANHAFMAEMPSVGSSVVVGLAAAAMAVAFLTIRPRQETTVPV